MRWYADMIVSGCKPVIKVSMAHKRKTHILCKFIVTSFPRIAKKSFIAIKRFKIFHLAAKLVKILNYNSTLFEGLPLLRNQDPLT